VPIPLSAKEGGQGGDTDAHPNKELVEHPPTLSPWEVNVVVSSSFHHLDDPKEKPGLLTIIITS
jgi:hypothetical protein